MKLIGELDEIEDKKRIWLTTNKISFESKLTGEEYEILSPNPKSSPYPNPNSTNKVAVELRLTDFL